ncbi:hypothetical protein SAMN05443287_102447 [Micromonospora phaseoli]|uniref:DUF4233 domain-containing protein n=1 Tax=Micromonospora phaseoli TaxID=1144548 RepID=A0A1H6V2J8_9ACTN|nr:hypothetical protein [Micromonospora phaseoli]PZV93799.1 hypothetical protein CLV64_109260 [Micromonospora phaseoli]GIJ79925.1 hypothetical protein Xph01_43570 [Micromonospora phaseoli]SEI97204.1 hypothetical protein SAMN05443287_102447 [Micromonospora phaseoli]
MVVRPSGGGYRGLLRQPATPTPVRVTVLVFAVLSLLFTLATVHRLVAGTGSLGAVVFFAVMAGACGLVAISLAARRPWAPYPAYALTTLLAAASLGLFGAITIVGLALLAWVLWALNVRASRDWFGRRGRLR